jgi:hypothetical protein
MVSINRSNLGGLDNLAEMGLWACNRCDHELSPAAVDRLSAFEELEMESIHVRQRKHALREAACAGDSRAMYDFALLCEDSKLRHCWLTLAAKEGHVDAMCRLAEEMAEARPIGSCA